MNWLGACRKAPWSLKEETKMTQENVHINRLTADLEARRISRREFVRFAALMGLAAPTAYAMAGKITG